MADTAQDPNAKKKTSANKSFWKANRVAKRKAHYAAQFGITDRNRKRKMRRHVRAHPLDLQAVAEYEKTYGPVAPLGMTSKGHKRAAPKIRLRFTGQVAPVGEPA
jgi:hypothetical protein